MRLSELLESDVAALPKARSGAYRAALRNAFTNYLDAAKGLDEHDFATSYVRTHQKRMDQLSDLIVTAVDHSLTGQPSRARETLDAAIQVVQNEFDALISIPIQPENAKFLFRMRREAPIPALTRPGLFHIPFDRRHLVGPQRYSVPGVPMLYLGSSLLVCWHELGVPPLREVWVSRFEPIDDLRVLNIGYKPALVGNWIANHRRSDASPMAEYAANYAIVWPLLAACSFYAAYRGSAFIEEYIIPQLLTSWLTEQTSVHIDGIRYFSMHLHRASAELCMNYVFAPRQVGDVGHCSGLIKKFRLTEPVLWEYAEQVRSPTDRSDQEDRRASLYVGKPQPVNYSHTNWGAMESQLGHLEMLPI